MLNHNDDHLLHDDSLNAENLGPLAKKFLESAMQALADNKRINPNLVLLKDGRGAIVEPPESELERIMFRVLLEKAKPEAAIFISSAWTTAHPKHTKMDAVPKPKDDPERRLVVVCHASSFKERFIIMQFYTQEPEDEGPVVWQEVESHPTNNNPEIFCGYFDEEG